MDRDFVINFLDADDKDISEKKASVKDTLSDHLSYKILISDDEIEVHRVTKMMLQNFEFEGRNLSFLHSYSGRETIDILNEHPDIAVIFLDVVMEKVDAGLDVVKYIRDELNNPFIRIILRTGQPGEAPEEKVLRTYDINDYRVKTEMTVQRIKSSLLTALRNYNALIRIENNRLGLEKIIDTSASLFKHNSIEEFFQTIIYQLSTFNLSKTSPKYPNESVKVIDGFVTMEKKQKPVIITGSGKYEPFIGKSIFDIEELDSVSRWISNPKNREQHISLLERGIIITKSSLAIPQNYIYIEGKTVDFDMDLIGVFMTQYAIALDNFMLTSMISKTQTEIIHTFADTIEKHFEETGKHIDRISNMMYRFSTLMHFSNAECEKNKVASTMHDIGKIAIPDSILKKPSRLTPEEYELIKNHPQIGYNILSKSELDILRIAADIALYHHEKYDGSGYPQGLTGLDIPLLARMMAIVDVFDAITHKRVYKNAESIQAAIDIIIHDSSTHFDPSLVKLFAENLDYIIEGCF